MAKRGESYSLGKKASEDVRKKMSESHLGEKNPMWRGDMVSYSQIHSWIRKHKPKPEKCELCGRYAPRDVANISGVYERNIDDYKWLCRSCHMKDDGRLKNLQKENVKSRCRGLIEKCRKEKGG